MELPTFYSLGLGLLSMGAYHVWDKNFKKRKCQKCGVRVKSTGHYYCASCFTERAREKGVTQDVDPCLRSLQENL
jgi:tRNA(Ile2) C34 agmatinyltransferase TiaS